MTQAVAGRRWTLLTSHGHVLVEIARNPQALIRELAKAAGLTERATASIVADLEDAGYVTRQRVGRRNQYLLHLDLGLRHPAFASQRVGPWLDLLTGGLLSRPGGPLAPEAWAGGEVQAAASDTGSAPLTVISSALPSTSR